MMSRAQAEKRRQQRVKLILSIGIAVIMGTSIFGVVVSKPVSPDAQFYDDIAISTSPLGLVYEARGKTMTFDNYPDFVEAVPINMSIFKTAIIVFDPNLPPEDLAHLERARISLHLGLNKEGVKTGNGISVAPQDNSSAYADFSIIPCNPQGVLTVLELAVGNETSVRQDGSCITVSGANGRDVLLAKDAVAYRFFRND